ncbi:formate dehydrogenase accessory sulfurtransferase FdhD [Acetobacter sp. AN02]|uniref:formate dehydrogenase accessory sulfurtransferase FdhD n=1 Tax=Acetobacter sp. AN02 TaxID=2894186 RepID=UPI0024342278|nr:formate dehydrogenase accessory sulfurtransferase FdhD [Acetobacter sp. AN02]MDG6093875.1 formate dehydrogenase accessory sulfurtransferase FdhD [Acetobacter sp. AN02]
MTALFYGLDVVPLGSPDEGTVLNVADEVPVRLRFNGIFPYGTMMMSPDQVEDFAYGFCLTEGIAGSAEDIRSVVVTQLQDGCDLDVTVSGACLAALLRRAPRAQTGHTGCGICGTDEIPAVETPDIPVLPRGDGITVEAIRRGLRDLESRQVLNAATRMVHAAAWADREGRIELIREDVGRHNALDKLIGARIRAGQTGSEGFCLLTSRYSYEMVLKTLRAGMAVVVAVSAPTYRAFRLAERGGQTLIAIARRDRQFLFCGGDRISG